MHDNKKKFCTNSYNNLPWPETQGTSEIFCLDSLHEMRPTSLTTMVAMQCQENRM